MPYKEIEYNVLAALNTPVERRSIELVMSIGELAALKGYDPDTVINAVIWLKSEGLAEYIKTVDRITHAKITPEGQRVLAERRFRRPDNT